MKMVVSNSVSCWMMIVRFIGLHDQTDNPKEVCHLGCRKSTGHRFALWSVYHTEISLITTSWWTQQLIYTVCIICCSITYVTIREDLSIEFEGVFLCWNLICKMIFFLNLCVLYGKYALYYNCRVAWESSPSFTDSLLNRNTQKNRKKNLNIWEKPVDFSLDHKVNSDSRLPLYIVQTFSVLRSLYWCCVGAGHRAL